LGSIRPVVTSALFEIEIELYRVTKKHLITHTHTHTHTHNCSGHKCGCRSHYDIFLF